MLLSITIVDCIKHCGYWRFPQDAESPGGFLLQGMGFSHEKPYTTLKAQEQRLDLYFLKLSN